MFSGEDEEDFDKLLGMHFLPAAPTGIFILLNGSALRNPLESNKAGNDSQPPLMNFHVNPGFIMIIHNVFR